MGLIGKKSSSFLRNLVDIKELREQTEDIENVIKQLRDGKFSNIEKRMDFLKLILPLALSTDKKARQIIKKLGDYLTDLGNEMLGDNIETDVIDEEELDVDYGGNNDRFIVVENKKGEKVKKKKYKFKTLVKE